MNWLKRQNWYWSLYYEHGLRWRWLPKPNLRTWHVLLLEGMDAPLPRSGWKQEIRSIQPIQNPE